MLTELIDGPDDLDALEYVRDMAAHAGHKRLAENLTELAELPHDDLDVLIMIRDQCAAQGI